MNCSICGNQLLFDRVVFHCSCGTFVHAYCWDTHVLHVHKPPFEIGSMDLNGEFIPEKSKVVEEIETTEQSEITIEDETIEEIEAEQLTAAADNGSCIVLGTETIAA